MASVRKSLALSFAQKYTTMAIALASSMSLARLLTPSEIGIYSVGVAVVGMAHMLRDFGVGNYLVQEKELTPDRIRTAFGVTLVIAWSMAVILIALSGPMSDFYNEPGVRQVLTVLSINFLLLPFSSPILSLLTREMNFGALFRINVTSSLVGATTSNTLAALEYGFISLAWGSVAGILATVIIAAIFKPETARVLPGLKEWRRVASFGGKMSAISLVSELGVATPELVIGRTLGFGAVGIFSRATGAVTLFNRTVMGAIQPVILPTLSAKARAGEDILPAYLRATSYITGMSWPFFAFLGLMAYPIVRIMFGDQWDAAVPLIQIMCITRFVLGLYWIVTPTMISIGAINELMKLHLLFQPINIALIIAAAFHSLEAVAGAGIFGAILFFLLSFFSLHRITGITSAAMLKAVRVSACVTVCSSVGPASVFFWMEMGPDNLWLPLILASLVCVIGWFSGLFAFKHLLRDEVLIAMQSLKTKLKR